MNKEIIIGNETIQPGTRKTVLLDLPNSYAYSNNTMPVHVIHGKKEGPVLLVSAAIHGNEINGTEIIRRLLNLKLLDRLHGTLIAVPIVNIYGFISQSRYLPDRRDLNRSFPGSKKGSMTSRLAHIFMDKLVSKCTHLIDLHTGAVGRENLPQIRAKITNSPETVKLAKAFGAPVILHSELRDGSLREAVRSQGKPVLLYEAGEALRFNEIPIRAGVDGILGVMNYLKMIQRKKKRKYTTTISMQSNWLRAEKSGLLRLAITIGDKIEEGETIGFIGDPLGENELEIKSRYAGIAIGMVNVPLVYEGEAIVHIAKFDESDKVATHVDDFLEEFDPLADVDEVTQQS